MPEIVAGVLIALVTALASIATIRASRKKIDAEGTKFITDAAKSLIEPLREEVEGLRERVAHLEYELEVWQKLAEMRGAQVLNDGGAPVPFETVMHIVKDGKPRY